MNQAQNPYGKVAVLYGGQSAEREVSLHSGQAVLAALQRQGVAAVGIDPAGGVAGLVAALLGGGFDRVFLALHGRGGEDGRIQGLLDGLGLPYTGSGVIGSALGMDKARAKLLWSGAGLPTPPGRLVEDDAQLAAAAAELGYPLAVKPVHEGSSFGVTRVADASGLAGACAAARRYDQGVLLERWIEGTEYTCAILGERALPMIYLETPREFFDYAAKYQENTTQYHCPCGLPADQETAMQALSLAAFHAIGARGWGRVDLMRDARGQAWLIEVNTIPGMTDHSLVPMAARAAGLDFDRLVLAILDQTLEGRRDGPGY